MTGPSAGFSRWRGTYGVLALSVAFAAGLMIYHRARRGGTHADEMAGRFQDALYVMERDPAAAAASLEALAERSSASDATPWILQSLAAAYAKQGTGPETLRKALDAYERVVERFPRHPAAPLSLMASAQIFEDLGGNDLVASSIYARVLKEYPDSPAARLVDTRFSVADILDKRKKDASDDQTPMTEQDVIQKKLQVSRRRFQEMLALQAEAEKKKDGPPADQPPPKAE